MISRCGGCGHRIWSEKHPVESIKTVLYFDDDDESDTHAEHVTHCPGCGLLLAMESLIPDEISNHSPGS